MVKELLAQHKVLVGAGVAACLVVLITSLGGGGSDDPTPTVPTTTLAAQGSPTTTAPAGPEPDSDIPALDCHALLTSDETADALNAWELGYGWLTVSDAEACTEYSPDDDRYFVIIQPGSPTDFEPDTRLLEVAGEDVAGVGDAARWFSKSESDPETLVGALAVGKNTPHGALHFRIVIGRPDVGEAELQELAVGLANTALPRFPGVEVEPPEPVVVTFEEESVDVSDLSYVDNLIAREQAGEWTRGEGLVATLQLLAGSASPEAVLRHGEVLDPDGSGVIAMAQEFIQEESEFNAEIEGLLDQLVFTRAELDAVPLEEDVSSLIASDLLVSASLFAQVDDCDPQAASCPLGSYLPPAEGVPDGKYRLFRYSGDTGWTGAQYQTLVEAVTESARMFETLGTMPFTDVILTTKPGKGFWPSIDQGHCAVGVPTGYQADSPGDFKQSIARFLSHCFVHSTLPSVNSAAYMAQRWWFDGLSIYLSGVVYPDNNLEHDTLPAKLAHQELADPIPARSYTNWVVYEYLHADIGVDGVLGLVGSLPSDASGVGTFAGTAGMNAYLHDLGRGLTDANVADLGNSPPLVPYEPVAWDLEISGSTEFTVPVPQLGIRRLHITVPDNQYACATYLQTGSQEVSWRLGGPAERNHDWTDGVPDPIEGEVMLVITSVDDGAEFTMEVEDLYDNPDCEDDETDGGQPNEPDDCNVVCRSTRYFFQKVIGGDG